MPKSFVLLLAEWRNRGLEEFRRYSFPPGNASLAQAYKKRKYLFDTISGGEERQLGVLALEESARALDRRRGAVTMATFYRTLHESDTQIVRREKRRRPTAGGQM